MPQIEDGPKGLNNILESTYASAIGSGKSKESASRIAWATAKQSYKKKDEQWVEKFYTDLQGIVLEAKNLLSLTKRKQDMQYLAFPLSKLSAWIKSGIDTDENGVEYVDIQTLLLNPYNKKIDQKKVESIKEHIKQTNKIKPLIYVEVDHNGEIGRLLSDGHHRFAALTELGYTRVPVQIASDEGLESDKKELELVEIKKEISSADVAGLDLTRQDLAGKPRRPRRRINEEDTVKSVRVLSKEEMKKGGEGSGSWDGPGNPRFAWVGSRGTAKESANEYLKEAGLPEITESTHAKVDPNNARRIADAYEKMKSDPNDPKVKSAYKALGSEVDAQFKKLPVKIEFTSADPYKSSKEMFDDVENNKRLKVFTGGAEHPLLGQKDENGVSLNDKFRAVHDYYGHAMFGHQFGPNGEESAWAEHSKMFSREAQKALTTETRGQNSWFNYSKENEGKPMGEKQFAEQKVGILPEEFLPKQKDEQLLTDFRPAFRVGSKVYTGKPGQLHSDVYMDNPEIEGNEDKLLHGFVDKKGKFYGRSELHGLTAELVRNQLQVKMDKFEKFLSLKKGGPGSGCQGPNCGRPSSGNKAFEEPFHSGSHIKQFFKENNVVVATTDKDGLSDEKKQLRHKELEQYLQDNKIPYRKGTSTFSEWGTETAFIISAPDKEQSDEIKAMFLKKYKQDAVLSIRNGHVTGEYKDGRVLHGNVDKLESNTELTSDYFTADGQKFRFRLM